MGKKSLLDDDEPVELGGPLTVNEEFAKRFQHNKEREERHRLEAKYPHLAAKRVLKTQAPAEDDDEDESSSSDDEDEEEVLKEVADPDFLQALVRIRTKDPALYNSDVRLFDAGAEEEEDDEDNDDESEEKKTAKKDKKLTLRQVLAKQALEKGTDSDSSDDDDEAGGAGARDDRPARVYDDEQRALREAFIAAATTAAEGVEGEVGGLLKKRKKKRKTSDSDSDQDADEAQPVTQGKGKGKGKDDPSQEKDVGQLLNTLFSAEGGAEGEGDAFLRKYILHRGWVDAADEGRGAPVDEDEEEVERQEAFEYKYNFRFEDPEGAKLQTFPRKIEGTVRKEESSRKRQRESKAQRKEEEAKREREEVKRLKNLKRREIEARLEEMQAVAGPGARADEDVLATLLEGDFDPDAWDSQMAAAFGDEYYGLEEEDWGALPEEADDEGDGDEEEERPGKRAPADPSEAAAQREELQRLLGEYHGLDYEDSVGGLKTRFRYRQVEPMDYGLSVEDILTLDDKELNRLVGLKRLAPYREDQGRLPSRQMKKMSYHISSVKREKDGGPRGFQGDGGVKKYQKHGGAGAGVGPAAADPKEARLRTFARPTLKEAGGGEDAQGGKKKEKKAAPEAPANAIKYPEGLTKAQKKNFKRALKRKDGEKE